ncbi:MAG TPA: BTAD domain-containing putative transcriptional regulator [Ignavibacteria bacterium]|nr:BTAD domain-containing putative transcriptional regulator [Ignavibacteria bacterium]
MNRLRVRQVIQTRITPPKAPQNIIARSGIVKLLSASQGKKILLVTAPAGYGKTTIINEYISLNDKLTAWVHITPDTKSIFDLLAYITGSLKRINEHYGNIILDTLGLIENESEKITDLAPSLSELAGLMINELLGNFKDDILIVLDDFHELQNEGSVNLFLDRLINDLPDNVQLAIVTREMPKLNLPHLRAKREILEITLRDLTFSKHEIASLADKVYSKNLTDKQVAYLESAIGGWITGIHLVMQMMENNQEESDFDLSSIPTDLFEYFAQEILNKQNNEIKDFLLKTSHLENFDADVCNNVLNITNSGELLSYLLGKNIFLESKQIVDDNGKVNVIYDYIQLFRSFLESRSEEILTAGIKKSIYLNTSNYYCSARDPEKAIDYALLSGDNGFFEKLLIENFDELFINGKFEKLWKWSNAINENDAVNKKNIFYYKGILCKFYLGKLDKAIEYLDRSIQLSEIENDENFKITATVSRLEVMMNQGKTAEALKILVELEKSPASDINKAKIFYYLGNINFQQNDLDTAQDYANKALALCRDEENTINEDIYNMLGNINIIRGEFVPAIHYYELTLSITRSLQKRLVVQGNLAILFSRSGRFAKARLCFEETQKILKLFTSPVFDIVVKMTEYNLNFETGDYEKALLLAEEINNSALKLKNSQYLFLSYQFLGECSYFLDRTENSVRYLELAEKYMNNSSIAENMLILLLNTISKFETKPARESERDLLEVYEYLGSIGSNYDRSIAGFYLAKCYRQENPETCKQYLDIVFTLSKEKGYFSFMFREYLHSPEVFDLYGAGIKTTIAEYISAAEEISGFDWVSKNYRNRLKKFVNEQYDLKMLAFGGLKFILKGDEIPEKKWLRKKRKLMLCFLFLSANKTLTKDKIVDIFFGDTPLESIDNTFHQAVSNIRTALRTDTAVSRKNKPESDDLIIYEDKNLRLNSLYSYYSDLDDFDKLINKGFSAQNRPEAIEFLQRAASLYSGGVLEGYYEDWCESLREEYKNRYIKCAEKLIETLVIENRFEEVIAQAEKLSREDNLNFISLKGNVAACLKLGRINYARNIYEKFLNQYENEIGEKPNRSSLKEIESLFEK